MSKLSVVNNKIENIYPLTPLQEGMLYHYLLDENTTDYVLQSVFSLNQLLDDEKVETALSLLSARYSVLRTCIFHQKITKPQQVVLKQRKIEYIITDLSNKIEKQGKDVYEQFLKNDINRGFDLQKDSLLRIQRVRLSTNEEKLIWTIHHIILDGWCLGLLIEKFFEYYEALVGGMTTVELEAKMIEEKESQGEYSEYIKWLTNQDQEKAKKYWREQLAGYESNCEIKAMRKPEPTDEQMNVIEAEIKAETTSKLKKYAESNGCTINSVSEIVCGIMLQVYSGSRDVVFGKVVSGRNANIYGIENMIGLFINTIPVRVKVDSDTTVTDLLKKQQQKGTESTNYDYCSLAEIQNMTEQGAGLIKVLYVFENYTSGLTSESIEEEALTISIDKAREQTNYPISITGYEKDENLCFKIMYNPNDYCVDEIELILSRIVKICEEIAKNPNRLVSEIETVTEKEKELILNNFNSTKIEYPREKTVVELFEEQVEKNADSTAIVFEEESLTYVELNEKANSLAHKLREKGVKPDDFVAIIADRSIEMIAGIYGIIKAGGAYVPIDPTYPEERIKFILEDCVPKVILKYTTKSIKEICRDIPVIDLSKTEVWEGIYINPEHINTPNDLIYCIYTSGTTGHPKGVMNNHKGIVNIVNWLQREYPLDENDVILQKTTYVFDVSASEIFWWFIAGAKLAILKKNAEKDPEEIIAEIFKYEVTVIDFVPSMLSAFLSTLKLSIKKINTLKYVLAAGEALNVELVRNFYHIIKENGNNTLLCNIYGPTEASIYSTYYNCEKNFNRKAVPIGKPVSNTQMYILNKSNLCGIGVPGELCIVGEGLARGYLNRPELTEEKFVKNPFGEGRMYRTGDLARWLPDGNIEYLGRIDEQVKIRGFRIELGEIESRIREIENIKDCAVIAKADSSGDKVIYAYYTSRTEVSISDIRSILSKILPAYMIPTYMMQIAEIPLNRNGKLDKRALPEIEAKTSKAYIAPRTETEVLICQIFSEILNVKQVGVQDNFFELGGHSLRATRLVNQIEAQTGHRIALKNIFSHSTPELLAELVDGSKAEVYEPIPKAKEKEYYPMSSTQKRTYLIQKMQPESIAYNMPQNLRLTGKVDSEKIYVALQTMIDRHEILRTQFLMLDGQPVQKILKKVKVDFTLEKDTESSDITLLEKFVRPFDLSNPPLVRIKLVERKNDFLLLLDMHHIVGDGMSMGIFTREFMALYNGEKLDNLPRQYKDYSEWMRERNLVEQKEFWINQYRDEIPVLDIPLDYARPQEQSYRGAMLFAETSELLGRVVKKVAAKYDVTEYMVFLSAAMVLLSKYSNQEDIVIGSVISARTHKDTENMLGMFVNTLAMRGRPEGKKTFKEFLKEIKEICMNAYENQEYPFEELVEAVDVQRDFSRNPLFDVMLIFQNNEASQLELSGTKAENTEFSSKIAKFDITFNISSNEDKYYIIFEYCIDLFFESSAQQMLNHYLYVLKQLVQNPDILLKDVETATSQESQMILKKFNATSVPYSKKTVCELFEEQVAKMHEHTAVTLEEENLSYTELNSRANVIAHKLRKMGIGRNDLVAIYAKRSTEMIVGIYGVIKAGAAYVPIDPMYPKERVKFMLEDSQPKAVLVYQTTLATEVPIINLSDISWEVGRENLPVVNQPNDLAYCIYTSGTTGRPKGVLIEHHGIVAMNEYLATLYQVNEADNVLQFANYVFDASVWEMTMALLNGATLVLVSTDTISDINAFNSYIQYKNITLALLPPQYYLQSEVSGLKVLTTGGSATSEAVVIKAAKEARYINAYGPTENTVLATHWEYEPGQALPHTIPIGKPISNTKIYILLGEHLCGIGVPGELCITGDGLARGYLNRPELTEEKFVKNPFGNGRMYRSGDLARWLPDGNIEFLGRIDEQVKIRGFRIELGEIENRIREINNIKDCAVIAKASTNGDKAIYAYYTSKEEISISEIRNKLSEVLPAYMIPAYMLQIDEIPVNSSGKVNRRALPEITANLTKEYVAPENDIQKILCDVFAEVLNVNQVGITDNYFEMGGDSINAIQVSAKLKEYDLLIDVREIMAGKTIKKIARSIRHGVQEQYSQTPFVGEVKMTPIMDAFFHGWNMADVSYFNQSMMLKSRHFNKEALRHALKELAIHHDMLRCVYRKGGLWILPVEESQLYTLEETELYGLGDDTLVQNAEIICTQVQERMNVKTGPILRCLLLKCDGWEHLMLCIHHISVDGLSWRILTEDLINGYTQYLKNGEIHLPLKTASFADWTNMLYKHRADETDYWRAIQENSYSAELQGDLNSEQHQMANTCFSFDKQTTDIIVTLFAQKYHAEINDVLLTALIWAVHNLTNQTNLAVNLESHGRETVFESKPDISRTVGWFTSIYPIILSVADTVENTLLRLRVQKQNIPNYGLGYGLVCGNTSKFDVSFNFFGKINISSKEESGTIIASELSCGENMSSDNQLFEKFGITGSIVEGVIGFNINYDSGKYSETFVQRFVESYHSAIAEMIQTAQRHEGSVYTIADIQITQSARQDVSKVNEMISKIASTAQNEEKDLDALLADFDD